jgi:hypothetical protein
VGVVRTKFDDVGVDAGVGAGVVLALTGDKDFATSRS